jgi:CubicO group peptidase (beta-lactamase class C family)
MEGLYMRAWQRCLVVVVGLTCPFGLWAQNLKGLDPLAVERLKRHLEQPESAVRSVLISRDGALVFEHYAPGVDPNMLHNIHSVTKSVVSLLVGIAIDKGQLRNVDETLVELFPQTKTMPLAAGATSITLRHLLTLSTGFDHRHVSRDTEYNEFQRHFYAPRLLEHALSRALTATPGQQFQYSNMDAHLAALALAQRTGVPVSEYARQNLFAPLGIANYQWPSDIQQVNNGASELRMRPLDMLKIGQLVLQRGRWNGRQIVSSEYIAQATQRQVASDQAVRARADLTGYGYLWWAAATPNDELPATYAVGYGGQFVYVVPALGAVIVATTQAQSRAVAGQTAVMIRDFALPALIR